MGERCRVLREVGPIPEAGEVGAGVEEAPALCPSSFGWRSGKDKWLETGKKEAEDLEESRNGGRGSNRNPFSF